MAKFRLILAAVLLSVGSLSVAQSDQIDGYDQNRPQRGMSMKAVERAWGSPETRRAAIGDPPISRWEYSGFTVYFEHNHVIHAVAK